MFFDLGQVWQSGQTLSAVLATTVSGNLATIQDKPVPLANNLDAGHLALVNLIVTGLAFLLILALAVVFLVRYYRHLQAISHTGHKTSIANLNSSKLFSGSLIWFVIAAFAALLGLFFFTFSQAFTAQLIPTDQWTPTQVLLFTIQVVATIVTVARSQKAQGFDMDNSEDYSYYHPPASVRESQRLKLRSDQYGQPETSSGKEG